MAGLAGAIAAAGAAVGKALIDKAKKNSASKNTGGSTTSSSSYKSSSSGSSSNKTSSSSSGMSQGKDGSYYGTGGSGKQFGYNPSTGGIAITQNGQTRYVGANDPNYANTKKAMEADVGFSFSNLGNTPTSSSGSSNKSTNNGSRYSVGSNSSNTSNNSNVGINYDSAQKIASNGSANQASNILTGAALGSMLPGSNIFSGMLAGGLGSNLSATTNQNTAVPATQSTASGAAANGFINAGDGEVSGYGEGVIGYDPQTNAYYRIDYDGTRYDVPFGSDKWDAMRQEYLQRNGMTQHGQELREEDTLEQIGQLNYDPVDQSEYTSQILSYDEAMEIAREMLEPQYQQKMQQTAMQVAQNLERSGMYDSLYGQALIQNAQNAVVSELESAVADLAGQMVGESRQQMLQLLQMAVNENQYGASYDQSNLFASMDYIQNTLNRLQTQLNADRDYDLAVQAQALNEKLANNEISLTEAQIQAQQLENELMRRELNGYSAVSYSSGSSSSSGGRSRTTSSSGRTTSSGNSSGNYGGFTDSGGGSGSTIPTMAGTGLSAGGQQVLNSIRNAKTTVDKEAALTAGVIAGKVKDAAEAEKIANIAGIRLVNLPSSV